MSAFVCNLHVGTCHILCTNIEHDPTPCKYFEIIREFRDELFKYKLVLFYLEFCGFQLYNLIKFLIVINKLFRKT